MVYWQSGVVLNALMLLALLLLASLLAKAPGLRSVGIPVSILAGLLGLLLGPDVVGWLPFDRGLLESAVYHGLAIMFIAVGLESPPKGRRGAGALSIAFAVPTAGASQALVGLLVVLFLGGLHPGIGLLAPYGFEQGPGQALAIGKAWEALGLQDGAQIGLIIASLGFAWAIVVGVPLVAIGRARGWVSPPTEHEHWEAAEERAEQLGGGTLEVLTSQVVAIGCVYLVTYGIVAGAYRALSGLPDIAEMVWGFQYIVGAIVAIPARSLVVAVAKDANPLDDEMLSRLASLAVDVVTCAALTAVAVEVFRANWLALLLVTSAAGLVTLAMVLWVQRRAFPQEPFEHGVVLFGMATGTLPMGFALLRTLDPEMKGTVPNSCVYGSAIALLTAAPLYLFVLLIPVQQWPEGHPGASWLTVGILVAYLAVIFVLWRWIGPLRFRRPFLSPWPEVEEASAAGRQAEG